MNFLSDFLSIFELSDNSTINMTETNYDYQTSDSIKSDDISNLIKLIDVTSLINSTIIFLMMLILVFLNNLYDQIKRFIKINELLTDNLNSINNINSINKQYFEIINKLTNEEILNDLHNGLKEIYQINFMIKDSLDKDRLTLDKYLDDVNTKDKMTSEKEFLINKYSNEIDEYLKEINSKNTIITTKDNIINSYLEEINKKDKLINEKDKLINEKDKLINEYLEQLNNQKESNKESIYEETINKLNIELEEYKLQAEEYKLQAEELKKSPPRKPKAKATNV